MSQNNKHNLTSNDIQHNQNDRSPEEATLIKRLRVFCVMRWYAIGGIIAATLVAQYILKISFPILPVYLICASIAIYNMVVIYQARNLDKIPSGMVVSKIRSLNYQHRSLDFVALTILLHFTGGIENPFVFLFVLHVIAASVPLPYRTVYIYATLAILAVGLLAFLEYASILPHVHLNGYSSPTLYKDTNYIVGVITALTVVTYSCAYVATAIAGELRKRQREVFRLQEQLLTERTKELELASHTITQLDEEKKHFLYFLNMAAHDLKAPLTAIQGFLWLILKGFTGTINEKQKNILERSSIRITELLNLISDLLDIPRIEQRQFVSEMKDIFLGDIIKQVVDELNMQASEKHLVLNVNIPESPLTIYGSPTRLKQVITNLITNAIKYTASGFVNISLTDQNDSIEVEITDSGIGIPESDLPRIFEDFFRASNANVKGTGLGLSISRRIIEAHGGKIWVQSPCENGNGSKFTFSIPRTHNLVNVPDR